MNWSDVAQRHIDKASQEWDAGNRDAAFDYALAAIQGLLNHIEASELGA